MNRKFLGSADESVKFMKNIITGSWCTYQVAGAYLDGLIEKIYTNHLGQICFIINGQIYSDYNSWDIWCRFKVGDSVYFNPERKKNCQSYEARYGKIVAINPPNTIIQIWGDKRWSQPIAIPIESIINRSDIKENVEVENAIQILKMNLG